MADDDTTINDSQNHFIVSVKRRDRKCLKASNDKFFYYTWAQYLGVCGGSLKTKAPLITWLRAETGTLNTPTHTHRTQDTRDTEGFLSRQLYAQTPAHPHAQGRVCMPGVVF